MMRSQLNPIGGSKSRRCLHQSKSIFDPQRVYDLHNKVRIREHKSFTWTLVLVLVFMALVSSTTRVTCDTAKANEEDNKRREYLEQLEEQDTCGAVYKSELHGYEVREYEIQTKDRYILKLHRLIHPEDKLNGDKLDKTAARAAEEKLRLKKPYLLVHGLIGTSASFVLNVKDDYKAPSCTYQAKPEIISLLKAQKDVYKHEFESTATRLQSPSELISRDRWSKVDTIFSDLNTLDYDGDEVNFAKEYRQAYKKFAMPKKALDYTSNSLAFTLSNFGYDVWMINLRGNEYSKNFAGRLSNLRDEYWNFDISKLAGNDLMAAIKHVQDNKGFEDPIGLVTYSYSAAYVMKLLTTFPAYAERLQPIVMMAPTLLTKARDRKQKSRYLMRGIDLVLGKNGPFPSKQRSLHLPKLRSASSLIDRRNLRAYASTLALDKLDETVAKLICKLPIASQLCRFMENVIVGQTESVSSVRGLIGLNQEKRALELMKRDSDCGRTSKAILHQILENINQANIHANFMASKSISSRRQQLRLLRKLPAEVPLTLKEAAGLRRSVILIHSEDDEVATPDEVGRLCSTALKTVTLLDYVIKKPGFGHKDFLFSHLNQYLVNAEIVRQVLIFDHFAYRSRANQPSEVPQGI